MDTKVTPIRTTFRCGLSLLSVVWLLACCSLAAWLLLGGWSEPVPQSGSSAAQAAPTPVAWTNNEALPAGCGYQSIETIRPGQRVVTPGTDFSASLPTAVDPATWKLVKLRMVNRWHDGTLDDMEIAALESPEWVERRHAVVGARIPLPVDVADLAEPDALAKVVAVGPCPPVQQGPGRVVLTTTNHLNNFVFSLTVRNGAGGKSTVGVTGWHKLYSESRGWVSTCTLKAGEVLRGREGPLTVTSLIRRHETDRVYNMTVEGEHVYYVSSLDLLSHNANSCARDPNNGVGPRHGSPEHDQAIQDHRNSLPSDATNIRKNQPQVDANGNVVGNNRPDLQYDINGVHHAFEADTNAARSSQHAVTITNNDPNAVVIQRYVGR